MAVILDVKSRLDPKSAQDTAEELRATMSAAIRDAVEDILFGLTITSEERQVVENHRNVKRARLFDGHRAIVAQLHAKVAER